MLARVLAEPLVLTADERYLTGHYLAYLLGGSRRKGVLLRRPLDPRNADRARLLLAMTWLVSVGPGEGDANVARAAELLGSSVDVRAALNPVVVIKYLASRNTSAKRKVFRQARKVLQDASAYAQRAMLDPNGVLNPGLMPQNLDDLQRIAPERDEVDDQLVSRWNRVAEVWRENADFRTAVLRYATRNAHRDPASLDLWPEVVYPLIERARWQREFRPRHEAVWDYLSERVLRVPDAGIRLDRMMVRAVPRQVAEELELEVGRFVDDPRLVGDEPAPAAAQGDDRLASRIGSGVSLHDLAVDAVPRDKALINLTFPDPFRFTQGELRDLWREAIAAMGKTTKGGAPVGHRHVPVGPYRLAVIPSIRGRSAGQVALQGMPNKQIEMLTPSIRAGGSGSKPVIAVWVYNDSSAVIVYLDFRGTERYIFWHAPNAQQFNYDDLADLNHILFTIGLEVPDQLDRVLSTKFRPRSPA
jgi:serine/threonine-protein kinase